MAHWEGEYFSRLASMTSELRSSHTLTYFKQISMIFCMVTRLIVDIRTKYLSLNPTRTDV